MKLIIVRHGETEENAAKIMMGQTHGKLSANGIAQAKQVGQRLKDENIDFAYCSDLARTKDTVKEILKYHEIPVVYDPLLRERNLSVYQGRPTREFAADEEASGLKHEFRPENGEKLADVRKRAELFINKIVNEHSDSETILICTHFGWQAAFISYFLDIQHTNDVLTRYKGENTAISIFEYKQGKPFKTHLINNAEHLETK